MEGDTRNDEVEEKNRIELTKSLSYIPLSESEDSSVSPMEAKTMTGEVESEEVMSMWIETMGKKCIMDLMSPLPMTSPIKGKKM
eukprot:c36019_g1_i1 orf=3-254(+)